MKVWGKSNDVDIIFEFDGLTWTAEVPSGSGAYTVELWAEDDAGNVSHMTTVLITYDVERMCVSFRVLEIGAGWTENEVRAMFGSLAPSMTVNAPAVNMSTSMKNVELTVTKTTCGGGQY